MSDSNHTFEPGDIVNILSRRFPDEISYHIIIIERLESRETYRAFGLFDKCYHDWYLGESIDWKYNKL